MINHPNRSQLNRTALARQIDHDKGAPIFRPPPAGTNRQEGGTSFLLFLGCVISGCESAMPHG
jgi:hypothetical protein